MSLRILSGMIFIPRGGIGTGTVTITFRPFEISAASRPEFELRKRRSIGPDGRFVARPASMVAVRQFSVLIGAPLFDVNVKVKIDDNVTRDAITISWSPGPHARVDQEEIPFIVIGEVPTPVSVRLPVGTEVSVGRRPGRLERRSSKKRRTRSRR